MSKTHYCYYQSVVTTSKITTVFQSNESGPVRNVFQMALVGVGFF